MKKILSIIVTITVVLSLAVPFVSATGTSYPVSAEEPTLFEIENFIAGDTAFKTIDWEGASGGKIVGNNLTASGSTYGANYTDEITFTINVTQAGKYDIETAFSSANSTLAEWVTWINVYIDDTKIDSNWYGGGTTVSTYDPSPISVAPIRVRAIADFQLTATTHTVKFQIQNAGSYRATTPTFNIDYIKFTPDGYAPTTNLESDSATTIEVEDYSASKAEASYCSGGAYATAMNDGTGAGATITIPINVPETGLYDFEAALAYASMMEYWSHTRVYLDDEASFPLISNHRYNGPTISRATAGETYAESPNADYPIKVYSLSDVFMTKGKHKLIITTTKPSISSYPNMQFDYIKITPSASNAVTTVGTTGKTTLEYENYVDMGEVSYMFSETSGVNATESTTASGGKYIEDLNLAYSSVGGADRDISFNLYMPISVTETGKYNLEYTIAKPTVAANGSQVSIKLGNTELGNNTTSEGTMVSANYPNEAVVMYKYKTVIELEAGTHDLYTVISCPTGQDTFDFALDSISLSPTMLYPEIESWVGNTVTASVYVRQNDTVVGGKNVVIILAWYDENNTMLGFNPIIDSIYTTTETIDASYTVSDPLATKAKLFVWEGTSVFDAGTKSLIKAVTLSK